MAKKYSKLQLVTSGASGQDGQSVEDLASVFDLTALGALSEREREVVKTLVGHVCPSAGIIAAARTQRSWDIRPVVMLKNEEKPSLIRSLHPDICLSPNIEARMRDLFSRLKEFNDLSSELCEWGVCDESLWYRRTLVDNTLADLLASSYSLKRKQVFQLARNLVEELSRWHGRGIVHGHLSLSNISVTPDNEVSLLDAGVAAASFHALEKSGLGYPLKGYDRALFAPELLAGQSVIYSADIFGLGRALYELFSALKNKGEGNASDDGSGFVPLEATFALSMAMCEPEVARRPTLSDVRRFFEECSRPVPTKNKAFGAKEKKDIREQSLPSGRILARQASEVPKDRYFDDLSPRVEKGRPKADPKREEIRFKEVEKAEPVLRGFDELMSPEESSFEQPAVNLLSEVAAESVTLSHEELGPRQDLSSFGAKPGMREKSQMSFLTFLSLLSFVMLGVWILFQQYNAGPEETVPWPSAQSVQYTDEQLEMAWNTGMLSRMKEVVKAAVDPVRRSAFAEALIINTAIRGEKVPAQINPELLRIAFDPHWEMELKPEDRRVALIFGCAGFFIDRDSGRSLDFHKGLEELHPGVVLALTTSAGQAGKIVLSKMPASILEKLPPPFGPAFSELNSEKHLSCGEEGVRKFSQLITGGVSGTSEIADFLKTDTNQRLRALVMFFSHDNNYAEDLLNILVSHPNYSIEHPSVVWAKRWGLREWSGLEAGDKLFILAGMPPAAGIDNTEKLAQLFDHPSPELRAYAVSQAADRIKFLHAGAYDILKMIKDKPTILDAAQTFYLAPLLEKPYTVKNKIISHWLSLNPSVDFVAAFLLETAEEEKPTKLDKWLVDYLEKQGWTPGPEVLKRLSTHPDFSTRLYAYTKIFQFEDEKLALDFLTFAESKEENDALREQLKSLIDALS